MKRCEGRRRKWRGHVYGTFACGRKATHVVTTTVGYSETHYCCEDGECFASITHGYPASSRRIEVKEVTRHMFDFVNNDGSTPLCHNLLTGGAVVRQVFTNVNCPACIDLYERAQA